MILRLLALFVLSTIAGAEVQASVHLALPGSEIAVAKPTVCR